MQILLANDDGIYAPGLHAMETALTRLGNVTIVAPATEQSGVGHSITYRTPLICKEIYQGPRFRGWAVEGSPADCVKIGVAELCRPRPDLIVSGINHGLNAGINVLYSGTVAAAIEGAFFGIDSVAVSLEFDEHADFDRAAEMATQIIEQILKQKGPEPQLFNLNIPTDATRRASELKIVPMGVQRTEEHYLKRTDPRGRPYYWGTGQPISDASEEPTDLFCLLDGNVTLTPLSFDMSDRSALAEMKNWNLQLSDHVSVS